MIKLKNLSKLCVIKNVFYFEGRLYERLYNFKCKYRVFVSDDDYDYVVDRNLRRRLDRACG